MMNFTTVCVVFFIQFNIFKGKQFQVYMYFDLISYKQYSVDIPVQLAS